MNGIDFLDSNVLIYAFDRRDQCRCDVAQNLLAKGLREQTAIISAQVVQETLNVLMRRLQPAMSVPEARKVLDELLVPLWRIGPSAALYARGLVVQERYGFNFYDSLIVAAALEAGCTRLLSEDMQHGQQIEGLRVENPFRLDDAV